MADTTDLARLKDHSLVDMFGKWKEEFESSKETTAK